MLLQIHKDQAWQPTPLEAEVARLMEDAFREYAATIAESPGDLAAMERAESRLARRWRDVVSRVLQGAGQDASAAIGTSFLMQNPAVEAWLAENGAKLVTQVSETTRQTIQDITRRGYINELTTREQSRLLREVVPLIPQHALSVEQRLATRLAQGWTERDAVTDAGREARRLQRWRADMIARTETMAGQNGGLSLAWQQADADGYLLPETRREWIATPEGTRTCELCKPWDGVQARVGEPFKRAGREIMHPPLHPHCRCTMGLRTQMTRGRVTRAGLYLPLFLIIPQRTSLVTPDINTQRAAVV